MFSQFGEDDYVLTGYHRNFRGYAAEIGAYDGHDSSNTFALEQRGWKVLCVEANPELEKELTECRDLVRMCACADYNGEALFKVQRRQPGCMSALKPVLNHKKWKVDPTSAWDSYSVQVRTLDSLLEEVRFPRLDVLSVDVEGGEMDVLKGFTLERWNPRFVILEDWDSSHDLMTWMETRGYRLDRRLGVNTCFFKDGIVPESIPEGGVDEQVHSL